MTTSKSGSGVAYHGIVDNRPRYGMPGSGSIGEGDPPVPITEQMANEPVKVIPPPVQAPLATDLPTPAVNPFDRHRVAVEGPVDDGSA